MRVLVIGATGGSGRAAVRRLVAEGHDVTAFSRTGDAIEGARPFCGDAMDRAAIERAVAGQDAVIVTLGIRENPLRVRLRGPARTAADVRSAGTRHVVEAMRSCGVRRLVVQTSYGVGETRGRLRVVDRLLFSLLLAPQIADTEVQESIVRKSGLDWVLVQPVHLTDDADDGWPVVSEGGETGAMRVSRASVARVLATAATGAAWTRRSIAVSGARRVQISASSQSASASKPSLP